MAEDRHETLADKHRVEAMVTAILTDDAFGQAVAADKLSPSEERLLRAGASIIAGLFHSLGPRLSLAPDVAWKEHMQATNESRGGRG